MHHPPEPSVSPRTPLDWPLYRVEGEHLNGRAITAGFVASPDGRIVEAPPILAWAMGKSVRTLGAMCGRRGWRIERICQRPP